MAGERPDDNVDGQFPISPDFGSAYDALVRQCWDHDPDARPGMVR